MSAIVAKQMLRINLRETFIHIQIKINFYFWLQTKLAGHKWNVGFSNLAAFSELGFRQVGCNSDKPPLALSHHRHVFGVLLLFLMCTCVCICCFFKLHKMDIVFFKEAAFNSYQQASNLIVILTCFYVLILILPVYNGSTVLTSAGVISVCLGDENWLQGLRGRC